MGAKPWHLLWGIWVLAASSWAGGIGSGVDWERLTPRHWLDLEAWRRHHLGDVVEREEMGRLVGCVGKCWIYRGKHPVRGSHRSLVREGDEIETAEDSHAWVVLWDGSLLRISPESGVALKEFNVTGDGFFLFLRLKSGHIFLSNPRPGSLAAVEEGDFLETDAPFPAPSSAQTQQVLYRPTYSLITMSNATLYGRGFHMEIYHALGRESFFQQQRPPWYGDQVEGDFFSGEFWPRTQGEEGERASFGEGSVYRVNSLGLELGEGPELFFARSAQLLRRVPSLLAIRGEWLQKYVPFLHGEGALSSPCPGAKGISPLGGMGKGRRDESSFKIFARPQPPGGNGLPLQDSLHCEEGQGPGRRGGEFALQIL